jgi:hypothetical protein
MAELPRDHALTADMWKRRFFESEEDRVQLASDSVVLHRAVEERDEQIVQLTETIHQQQQVIDELKESAPEVERADGD